MKKARDITKI